MFENLEPRQLYAVRTVDFNNYPVNLTQFDWMLQSSHTPASGFSYDIGTGDGQRPNVNGISWADSTYYESVLGAGGFNAVNSWDMKPVILYTQAKSNWQTQGWNYVPDMAEGAACIDDAGRAAVAYADDYLQNGTPSSYQTARDLLTFVAYMTTRQGKVYNFAWLDAAQTFAWDPIYSQNAHFGYRSEYVKRTQYPSASPSNAWFDTNSDTAHIVNYPSSVRANPFIAHPKFSVYIDDLRSASGADVATVYDGPLYTTASGGPTSFKTGIKKSWTNSTQAFGFDEGRAIPAMAKGLMMMQKREAETGGTLSADDLVFAKFLENNMNRMVRNLQTLNAFGFDSKLGSSILAGLADYYQLFYGTTEYGTYSFKLAANSNTAETGDDRPVQASLLTYIDNMAATLKSKQVRTADWRNGIFADDGTGQSWDAWGQQMIYALARTYRMKVSIGANPADTNVASLLDYAAYAADNFYGIEAYHYAVPGTNNVRSKERITGISGGGASYHTNSGQIAYHQASIVAGLRELAMAYNVSDRPDKVARINTYVNDVKSVASWFIGNNTALLDMYDGGAGSIAGLPFRNRGAAFDGINPNGAGYNVSRNTGGESFDEAAWAMILAKDAIRDFGASTTFSFETGGTALPAPFVNASSVNIDTRAVSFNFSQDVSASVHAFDVNINNLTTSQRIATSAFGLAYNFGLRQMTATIDAAALADGNYRVTLPAGSIVGNSGNPITTDTNLDFFVLGGDANRDRAVDISDFAVLAGNFGQAGSFTTGDFNYSGVVDIADFAILASRFGQNLPAARGIAPAGAGSSTSTPFGNAPIRADSGEPVSRVVDELFDSTNNETNI